MPKQRPFLTRPGDFRDVSRGNPKPYTLKGEALVRAAVDRRDLAAGSGGRGRGEAREAAAA